ncbi:UDP-N-acetylglucosamine 2-epimerase (non-hydrolyzing) [candidate division KSB1 bacterium]|nr:UDP-N-acetylglucosamine 2-epimerase (non-hydrolyzing) [candidate division KSB1 bacterium]
MPKLKVMTIFGTRPEAIKMAPIIKAMQRRASKFESVVVVTAQHREILDQPLRLFDIVPDYDLNIMTSNQTLFSISKKALSGLENVLQEVQPDIVLVQGDTTTTFISSLAAFYLKIPVGHVEAGLRTYNKFNPFPEELNRHLTTGVADFHFVPTQRAGHALAREGVNTRRIFLTGNTVIDVLHQIVAEGYTFNDPQLAKIDFEHKKIILLTTHRRESFGSPMENIMMAIEIIAKMNDDIEIVFPMHFNPNVRHTAARIIKSRHLIHLIEPLDYRPFVHLMARSHLILTDSGGIQEEATSLGKPVLILRETTERPEGVDAGVTKLIGTDTHNIVRNTMALLIDENAYKQMARSINLYGDGNAAEKILDVLEKHAEQIANQNQRRKNIQIAVPDYLNPPYEFSGKIKNALTINVEDWVGRESNDIVLDIFRILEFLAKFDVRATFFVLGWIAESFPEVVKAISDMGHEISSQGYSSQLIYQQSEKQFQSEVKRSIDILESIINKKVLGFRAPSYSIIPESVWAWKHLLDMGLRYDSSIFPIKHDRYGIPTAPRFPFIIDLSRKQGLVELPLSTIKVMGENIPIAGGGYLRLFPYWFIKRGITQLNSLGKPAIMYFRSWEMNAKNIQLQDRYLGKFRKSANSAIIESRITSLLEDFEFAPIRDILGF